MDLIMVFPEKLSPEKYVHSRKNPAKKQGEVSVV
jgi:hypothetical protein